jgi:hypothetical protein
MSKAIARTSCCTRFSFAGAREAAQTNCNSGWRLRKGLSENLADVGADRTASIEFKRRTRHTSPERSGRRNFTVLQPYISRRRPAITPLKENEFHSNFMPIALTD